MPFKNNVIARMLTILGQSGTKIVGFIDVNGFPRFDFYTGSEDELEPGAIFASFENATEPTDDTLFLEIKAPLADQDARVQLRSGGSEKSRVLATAEEIVLDSGFGNALTLFPLGAGIVIDALGAAASGITFRANDTHYFQDGRIRIDTINGGGLAWTDNGVGNTVGGPIFGVDMGQATDACAGGVGNIQIPHNFGHTNFRAVGNTLGGGGARWATRVPSNDTNTTIGFRIFNDTGGNPANGTNVTIEWMAFAFA